VTDSDGEQRPIEYPERETGLYYFDLAATIARSRVRSPDRYTKYADDYVETLLWAFGSNFRDFDRLGFFDEPETTQADLGEFSTEDSA